MKSDVLIVNCQFALHMSQKALGDLVGVNRRTIQRWQKSGCRLLPGQAKALADALRSTRPDLADAVVALGRETAVTLGTAPASAEVIEAVLDAAAAAGKMSADAVRPVVAAAFAKAEAQGVDVKAVIAGLAGD